MIKKCARLLFPEIRITFNGNHAMAFLNREKVFFDFTCESQDVRVLKRMFTLELVELKRTYLRYSFVKPKLIIDLTDASGDKKILRDALRQSVRRFEHLLAGFIDGKKTMII